MKQVVRVLATYSADLFGINSALYELGGLVVMHDASGCNSTYNTHDEPRWYTMDSMLYISGLVENDVILGNDEKLINDICEAAEEMHPKFISVSAGFIPLFMSTDMKGIAKIIEKRTGIPSFGFTTDAVKSYVIGAGEAFRKIAERFCPAERPPRISELFDRSEADGKSETSGKYGVNLLGVTPLDFSIVGNVEALEDRFEKAGLRVDCAMAMGYSLEEIAQMGASDVNVVVSSTGLETAKLLRERYGMPYVIGIPIAKKSGDAFIETVKKSIEDGRCRSIAVKDLDEKLLSEPEDYNALLKTFSVEQRGTSGTFIVGEPVFAASLRYFLEKDFGTEDVHIVCPTEKECQLLMSGDVMSHEEEEIEACFAGADTVIADPIYRRVLPYDRHVRFVDFPHEAYSGRMYRSHIPVFTGGDFAERMKYLLSHEEEIAHNDIWVHNEPFAKKPKY